MGVNITAYRQISPRPIVLVEEVEPHDPITNEWIGDTCFVAWVDPQYLKQGDNLVHQAGYSFVEEIHIISTMYIHYNELRQELAKMVGHRKGWPGPFSELIDFSDALGAIGPVTCWKLAQDFRQFDGQARFVQYRDFYRIYTNFRLGFEAAADNGAVTLG
ncbi:hypothetical protein D3C71_77420 [compost metagenome]